MPTNQATVTDVTRRMLRPLTTAETAWVGNVLDDAFRHIIVSLPDVGTALDSPDLPPDAPFRDVVVQVTCAMLIRVLQNPDGVLEETTDDYTRRLDAAVSTGQIQMTAAERVLLSAGTGDPEGAFSVRALPEQGWRPVLTFPQTTTDVGWWPTQSGLGRI
jgi:hypothetical protein